MGFEVKDIAMLVERVGSCVALFVIVLIVQGRFYATLNERLDRLIEHLEEGKK